MRAAIVAQWQTAAYILLIASLALIATGLPGYLTATFFTDCLLLLVPCTLGAVAMRRGHRRLSLGSGLLAAGATALLFWWALYASLTTLLTAGISAATLEGAAIAALLAGATSTIAAATGALWCAPATLRLGARRDRPPLLDDRAQYRA